MQSKGFWTQGQETRGFCIKGQLVSVILNGFHEYKTITPQWGYFSLRGQGVLEALEVPPQDGGASDGP